MELTIILDYIIISIIASITINSILRNFANKHNFLVDLPDRSRKFHKRPTPLTGGIGILIALLNPNKKVILIDRKTTFIDFLLLAKAELGLNNIEIIKADVLKTGS